MGLFKKCLCGKSARRVRQKPVRLTQLDLFNFFDFVPREVSNVRNEKQGSSNEQETQQKAV